MSRQQATPAKGTLYRYDDVPVRHVRFDFEPSTMAKYCWRDDAFSSAFILTFSTLIPHGERLVIDSVRARRDEIRDPALRGRVIGLIGQEAMHSRIHREFNAAYQAKGLPIDRIDRAGQWYFQRFLPRVLGPDMQLAVTCAIEHVTALMAERSFGEPGSADALDRQARDFLLWHLLEECEHKSVAFDVYQEVCGSTFKRRLAMVLIVAATAGVFAWSIRRLLATPGFAQDRGRTQAGRDWWFGNRGYFARLIPGLRRYFRADFHPDQIDTDALLHEWRERLFGTDGELAPNVVKTVTSSRVAA